MQPSNSMKPMSVPFNHPLPPGIPSPANPGNMPRVPMAPPRNFMMNPQPPPPGQSGFVPRPPSGAMLPMGAEPGLKTENPEPLQKKLKPDTETGLIPEAEFMARNQVNKCLF